MTKELVIDFKNDGAVEALHMDGFDLGFLGGKRVFRQTDIVFNEATQKWDLHYLNKGIPRFFNVNLEGFETYEVARDFEVRWLNDCRLIGIDPTSVEGIEVMIDLRQLSEDKPVGPPNVLVKSTFGCEHYKSVFAE